MRLVTVVAKIQQLQFLNVGCTRIKLISKSGRGRETRSSGGAFRSLIPFLPKLASEDCYRNRLACPRLTIETTFEGSSEEDMFLPKGSGEEWGAKYGYRAKTVGMLLGVFPKLPSEELSRITDLNTSSSLQRFLPKRLWRGFQNNCRRQTECQKACGISSR